ncbi:NADase-type glycan-binding domain-containing protein [Desulfovibrio inopinatus]|uniref:NADase-type glycan-binding domain-containing protein n=1 Tax=Desulfovibrio inopinatus TaxID=102109 RepID=UPI0004062D87|nr:hypothetical protein [Desulfovibrio inopinatus]
MRRFFGKENVLAMIFVFSFALAGMAKTSNADPISIALPVNVNASYKETNVADASTLMRAVDKRVDTAVRVGNWIEFSFFQPAVATRFGLKNGDIDPVSFRQHARIKTAEIHFSDGGVMPAEFLDTPHMQYVNLPSIVTSSLRLVVTSIYPGEMDDDVMVSEVSIFGYDPHHPQTRLTGRLAKCVKSRSSADYGSVSTPLYYCKEFKADDGRVFGCRDDLCFHPEQLIGKNLSIVGIVNPDNTLEILQVNPAQ